MLDNIVNKYNSTVHKTIKMKPIGVTDNSFAECNEDFNKKTPRFKVGDHVRISNYKEDILLTGQMKFLLLIKLKRQFHGLMVLVM